jgi:hypothetical protein
MTSGYNPITTSNLHLTSAHPKEITASIFVFLMEHKFSQTAYSISTDLTKL